MTPADVVEAVAQIVYRTSGRKRVMSYEQARPLCEADAREILEAAAPHLIRAAKAEAWDEGYGAMVHDAFRDQELVKRGGRLESDNATTNPYRK